MILYNSKTAQNINDWNC